MNILILGASGTVGGAIYETLKTSYDVHGTYNKNQQPNLLPWHISDLPGLKTMLKNIAPDIIISSLVGDFLQQSEAHRLMAEYLQETGGRMVFISTVNVFDGDTRGNHTEAAPPYPISQYGVFKQNCEEMLLWKLGAKCLVVRLPKVQPADEVSAIRKRLDESKPVYSNLYFNHTTPQIVADTVLSCLKNNRAGISHITNGQYISDADYVNIVAQQHGITITPNVQALTAENYCNLLGCNDVARLRMTSDGGFYLTMRKIT